MLPTLAIFAFTYVLIAGRRLSMLPIGRPAGALAGACLMVALAAVHPAGLSPREAFAAVEPNTIGLLFGMMVMVSSVADAGLFDRAAAWVAARRPSPVRLLYAVTLGSGLLSAFLLNDSVCLLLAPLVDRTARRARLDRVPYLFALAMGSNAGSAMTLAGNPQNMLIAGLSGLSYRGYLLRAGPAALLALGATAVVLHAVMRSRLRPVDAAEPPADPAAQETPQTRPWVPVVCLGVVSLAFLAGANLAWTALIGATLVILMRGRDPSPLFDRVSWTVLVFFAALFIVVAGLQKAGVPQAVMLAAAPHLPRDPTSALGALSGALLVGCQIISNVPFILLVEPLLRLLPDPELAWTTTAVVSTLAGNLTLLGSVANIIVVEGAHAEREIGFRAYLKVGAPVTLVSTAVALGWLLLVPAWGR
jgi:Na+/H+ antiporter NhaD/arsenite permease-like protein